MKGVSGSATLTRTTTVSVYFPRSGLWWPQAGGTLGRFHESPVFRGRQGVEESHTHFGDRSRSHPQPPYIDVRF